MRNSINNLLPRTINYNYRQSVCPLQVKVSNTTKTNKTKKIAVFGSALNEFENNDIVPSQMNVSYSLLQKQLLSTSYHIGLMRITTDVKSQKKLKNLVISLESFDSSGQSIQIPILVGTYIKKGQFQKSIVDVVYPFYLNSKTQLVMDVPKNTSFVITLFPDVVKDINGTRMYGNGLITEVANIKHSFAYILYDKCNEAKKIKEELESSKKLLDKEVGLETFYDFNNYTISETIENLLIDLHNMPCDLYRNMVNLYVELDKYISLSNEMMKANEAKIKELKNKKRNIHRKILSKIKAKKTINETKKVVSKKVKKSINNKPKKSKK